MRILIADDDPVVRLFVKNVIEHQGHEVLETSDGSQAWALYQERAVDVAVIDWEMPELTGLEDPGKGPRRSLFLIGSYQRRKSQNMSLQGFFQLCLGGSFQVRQHGVQRIEFVEVTVPADGGTGPSVTGAFGRDVVEHPMDPGHPGCRGVRGVGVVHDERQASGALRQP